MQREALGIDPEDGLNLYTRFRFFLGEESGEIKFFRLPDSFGR